MSRIVRYCLVALVIGCGYLSQPTVEIHNDSTRELRDVRVSGKGFAESVGSIPPGGTRTVRVRPNGETGLAVSFNADGRTISIPEQGYFEAGHAYQVDVTIKQDLSVTVKTTL